MCECEQQLLLQRVMASGLYILMRFFLRVDGVIVRMNDTRIHHQVLPTVLIQYHTLAIRQVQSS